MGESYVEVNVTATLETLDALADFLFAEGALGLLIADPTDSSPEVLIRASFPGHSPIEPILKRLSTYQRALTTLGFACPDGQIAIREIPPTDWGQTWKEHFTPLPVGRRLIIAPPWDTGPFHDDRLVIHIDPGMSFGTGHHGTTRMCLEALEACIEQWAAARGPVVLDVGTGTGILAIAAAVLGAEHVVAIDTDPEACDGAGKNLSLNNVTDRVELFQGGVETLGPEMEFDLALANLDAKGLSAVFSSLSALLLPHGRLIASGVLLEEEGKVTAAARDSALEVTATQSDGEWICLVLAPRR